MKKTIKKPIKRPVKKTKRYRIKTDYLPEIYSDKYTKVVQAAAKKLRAFKKKHNFEAIAFRGSSGAALAYPLSYLLKVPLIHVRKRTCSSNYYDGIEGVVSAKSYIIVDDFISSGNTVESIMSEINSLKTKSKPMAILLYSQSYHDLTDYDTYRGLPVLKLKVK